MQAAHLITCLPAVTPGHTYTIGWVHHPSMLELTHRLWPSPKQFVVPCVVWVCNKIKDTPTLIRLTIEQTMKGFNAIYTYVFSFNSNIISTDAYVYAAYLDHNYALVLYSNYVSLLHIICQSLLVSNKSLLHRTMCCVGCCQEVLR